MIQRGKTFVQLDLLVRALWLDLVVGLIIHVLDIIMITLSEHLRNQGSPMIMLSMRTRHNLKIVAHSMWARRVKRLLLKWSMRKKRRQVMAKMLIGKKVVTMVKLSKAKTKIVLIVWAGMTLQLEHRARLAPPHPFAPINMDVPQGVEFMKPMQRKMRKLDLKTISWRALLAIQTHPPNRAYTADHDQDHIPIFLPKFPRGLIGSRTPSVSEDSNASAGGTLITPNIGDGAGAEYETSVDVEGETWADGLLGSNEPE